MKIIDTSSFEKLKIRPVNVNDINRFVHVNPRTITLDEIHPGYILKTRRGWHGYPYDNIFMFFETARVKSIIDHLKYIAIRTDYVILRPDRDSTPRIHYNSIYGYLVEWPKYHGSTNLDVTDVWITHFDVNKINSEQDILDIYNKYNLFDL